MNEDDTFKRLKKKTFEELDNSVYSGEARKKMHEHARRYRNIPVDQRDQDGVLKSLKIDISQEWAKSLEDAGWTRDEYERERYRRLRAADPLWPDIYHDDENKTV